MVSREIWAKVVNSMKQQCALAATSFIIKLEKCFPMQELLNVTRVIYSQYWFIPKVEITRTQVTNEHNHQDITNTLIK